MSKKTLLVKRVLTALALGSVLYAPVAMADSTFKYNNNSVLTYTTGMSSEQQAQLLYIGFVQRWDSTKANTLVASVNDNFSDLHLQYDVWRYDGALNLYGADNDPNEERGGGSPNVTSGNSVKVTVDTNGIIGQVVGASDYLAKNANSNTVEVRGSGKVLGDEDGEVPDGVVGGISLEGSANSNKVVVDGITVGFGVTGGAVEGYGYSNAQTGTANSNIVEIKNAKVEAGWIFGGAVAVNDGKWYEQGEPRATQALTAGAANNNVVTITGSTIGSEGEEVGIVGGLSDIDLGEDDSKKGAYVDKHRSSNVSNNTVTITNSTVYGDVYGGYSTTANAIDNEVELNSITLGDAAGLVEIMGGSTIEGGGNATDNAVTIDGGTFGKNDGTSFVRVYGAYGGTGIVSGNSITVTDANFQSYRYNELVGGSGAGNVTGNTVTFNGGTFVGEDIVGGQNSPLSEAGKTVSQNKVTISNADISASFGVYGGYSEGGNVTGNTVELKNAKFTAPSSTDMHDENVVYGGTTKGSGDVTGNSVTVTGGTFTRTSLIGGETQGTGNVTGNSVTIKGGTFTGCDHNGIGGGTFLYEFNKEVKSKVELGSASNNTVKITDAIFNGMDVTAQAGGTETQYTNVVGGLVELDKFDETDEASRTALKQYYTAIGASNNIVEITATTTSAKFGQVFGGATFSGEASGNKVTLSGTGIVVENDVEGGVDGDLGYTGQQGEDVEIDILVNANSNIVTLTDITVKDSVYGGEGNGTGSTASKNEVHILRGHYTNNHETDREAGINGGYAWTQANENIVEIKNAEISSEFVVGGRIDALDGSVKDNKVILDGVTFNFEGTTPANHVGTTVAGSIVGATGTFTGTRSGNTLEINANGFTVNTGKAVTIKNFEAMTFADGAIVTNNGDLTFEKNGDEIDPTDIVWTAKITGTGTTYFESDSTGEDNNDFTLGNELATSGGIVVAHDAKLRVQDAGYLGANVTNKGDVNLYGGTLSKVITNNADGANGTVKIKGDVALTSGNNIVGGTLQLKEGGHLMLNNGIGDTLTVGKLEAYSKDDKGNHNYEATDNKISFDAGKSVVDQISATTYKGTITLGSVGLKDEFEGNVGTVVGTYQLFTGSQDYSQLKINGSAEAVMGAYKYVFSDNGSYDGKLKITKDYGYSLQAIIQDSEPEHVAGQVGSYSLNGDKTLDADLGTLTRVDSTKAREFTINGNGNKLLGNGKNGITVNSGDTLTYKDIAEVSGFNGAAVTNNGTFNANNVTFKNEVVGNGIMNVDGEVTADAKVSNKMNIAGTGTLNIAGANVDNTVVNAGILNFLGGNLNYAITGGGTMNVKNTTVNADVSVAIVNVDNTTLNIASGKNFTVTNKLNMTNAAVVMMDKGNVLDKDLKVKTGLGDIINGVDGILVLRFDGAEYTATAHRDARLALFGDGTTEKAALQFDNAVLKIDEANETLGVQGTKTGNDVTMSGVQPTVYDKNGGKVEEVGGQAERTVGILNNNGGLESADKVSLEGKSNVTAKDLQIKEVVTKDQPFAIEVKNGSKLNLTGGDNGLVKDENGQPVVVNLTAATGSIINLGNEDEQVGNGKANVKELNVAGVVNVQNIDLNIDKLKVNGGTIVFDPSYHKVTTLDFGSGTVQVVTDGTVVNVGMDKDDLKAALDSAGLATTLSNNGYIVGDGHGVLALGQQVDLTGSGKHLVVDAKNVTIDKALQLGDGAVLVAQKEEATADTPVVKLGSKEDASIADTAQLVISADKYQKDGGDFISYIVLDQGADEKWAEGNIYAADPTYKFTLENGKLVADWNKVEGIFGENAISAPEMYNRILQKEQNTDANKFLKDVINKNASAGSTAATKAAGAAALNAVTSLGELAAVNHGLYTVSNQMTDAVANHMRLIDNEEASRDIWAAYIHNKEDVEELKLGGIDADYSAKYNGVVVGADLAKSDKGNVGVALSYVDGDISGATAGVRTRNDAKYYGASLYGRVDGKAVSLLGDISYMHGKGDIAQTVMGQEITADAKSDAISVGVRLEKAFKLGKAGRLMPYIGARYMSINTKDYHNSLGMNYDTDRQNLFMAPVGIAYSAHIEDNGWTYKPTFEAGYVFNMGDKNVDQKVSYNGYGDTFGMDVVDNGYWFGRVGFAAERKHMAYSLGYQYMKSNNAKNNKYMVNVVWKF